MGTSTSSRGGGSRSPFDPEWLGPSDGVAGDGFRIGLEARGDGGSLLLLTEKAIGIDWQIGVEEDRQLLRLQSVLVHSVGVFPAGKLELQAAEAEKIGFEVI